MTDPLYKCDACPFEGSAWDVWQHLSDPNNGCSNFILDHMLEVVEIPARKAAKGITERIAVKAHIERTAEKAKQNIVNRTGQTT